jgi:hypothetical protein
LRSVQLRLGLKALGGIRKIRENIIIINNTITPESCLENDSYKLYFDRTILTDIHIKHNRPDIIILNKQQKQAYLLDIAVPNSHNTYNTDI